MLNGEYIHIRCITRVKRGTVADDRRRRQQLQAGGGGSRAGAAAGATVIERHAHTPPTGAFRFDTEARLMSSTTIRDTALLVFCSGNVCNLGI